jgi:hypothetical protein
MSLIETTQSRWVLATNFTTVQDAVSALGLFVTICVCVIAFVLVASAMLSER